MSCLNTDLCLTIIQLSVHYLLSSLFLGRIGSYRRSNEVKHVKNLVLKVAAAATAVCLFAVLVAPLSRRKKMLNCELGLSLQGIK